MTIKTVHGNLKLPIFMPDATRGFIKISENQELLLSGFSSLSSARNENNKKGRRNP